MSVGCLAAIRQVMPIGLDTRQTEVAWSPGSRLRHPAERRTMPSVHLFIRVPGETNVRHLENRIGWSGRDPTAGRFVRNKERSDTPRVAQRRSRDDQTTLFSSETAVTHDAAVDGLRLPTPSPSPCAVTRTGVPPSFGHREFGEADQHAENLGRLRVGLRFFALADSVHLGDEAGEHVLRGRSQFVEQ